MMLIEPADLEPFATIDLAKAEAMIADATAMAYRVAPCLETAQDASVIAAAKAILRGAILRWNDAGSGAYQAQQLSAGPFGQQHTMDTRQQRRSMYWPSEIDALSELCTEAGDRAYTIDQVQPTEGFDLRPDLRFQYGWPAGY